MDFRQPPRQAIVPGDELEVRFFGAPNLNLIQRVSADGKINLPLLGPFQAGGLTVAEVQTKLDSFYDSQLLQKEISVLLRTPAPVYVVGSVLQPGPVPMSHPLTVFEAVTAAGGFDQEQAEVRSVVVVRQGDDHRDTYILDFEDTVKGKGTEEQAFYLQPYDVVFVPRTRITKINQAVDQYINRMLPRLGLRYDSDGVIGVYR